MAHFKAVFHHLPGQAKQNNEKTDSDSRLNLRPPEYEATGPTFTPLKSVKFCVEINFCKIMHTAIKM
jgi:hypothetical protein